MTPEYYVETLKRLAREKAAIGKPEPTMEELIRREEIRTGGAKFRKPEDRERVLLQGKHVFNERVVSRTDPTREVAYLADESVQQHWSFLCYRD